MRIIPCLRPLSVILILAVLQGPLAAQDTGAKSKNAATNPYAFSTRVYRLPGDDLIGFASKDSGQLSAPALPPPSANQAELEAFLKQSDEVTKEYLALHGITLPTGSLACYDPVSGTLALRTMQDAHGMVEYLANFGLNQGPGHLAWTLNILEAATPAVIAAMKEATGISEHTAVFDKLLPQAKIMVTMRGETKGGQQMVSNQGPQLDEITEYLTDEKQRVQFALESRNVGTQFDLDPVIGADHIRLDLKLQLKHPCAPPIMRWDQVSTASTPKLEAYWLDYPMATIQTAITMNDGDTCLLGVWGLDGARESERVKGWMQAAFLRVAVVRLQPLPDLRVEQILAELGEAVIPTPKVVPLEAEAGLPPGMSVRRFRISTDFLSVSDSAPDAPADPFAAGTAPRFPRIVTAEDILKSQGIPFPTGASANLISQTHELVVRNTTANLDLVETFLDSIMDGGPPIQLGFTLHIVQADAALIRRLERETLALPDHTAAWKILEDAATHGTAKIVGSDWLETKSGQRAKVESGIEYSRTSEVKFSGGASAKAKPPATEKTPASPLPSAVAPSTQPLPHLLSVTKEMTFVGLCLEVDPVIGADGSTVDLNLAVDYDYAPPVRHLASDPAPDQTQRLAAPLTEFRRAHFQTATTVLSGSTRMLSVWKPSGTPELDGDILQAAFLRTDIVIVEPSAKAK